MTFVPSDSMRDSDQMQPQSLFQSRLLQLIKRRKNNSPNPSDGFYAEQGKAASDAQGDGVNTTSAPGATSQQN